MQSENVGSISAKTARTRRKFQNIKTFFRDDNFLRIISVTMLKDSSMLSPSSQTSK